MQILGHRGMGAGNEEFPENSMKSFEACLKAGAEGIELDVYLGDRGELLVFHEGNTTLQDGKSFESPDFKQVHIQGKVRDILSGEQTEIAGEVIPKLREVLGLLEKHPQAIINIELKGPETAQLLAQLLRQKQINPKNIVVSSFNTQTLTDFKKNAPDYETALLLARNFDDLNKKVNDTGVSSLHPLIDPENPVYGGDVPFELAQKNEQINGMRSWGPAKTLRVLHETLGSKHASTLLGVITDNPVGFKDSKK